jgi:hypothetical protein
VIAGHELDDRAVHDQAEALAAFVRRGGSISRWLDSKGFLPDDRGRVLLAYADQEATA